MQDLIPFLCSDDLFHQRLSVWLFSQIIQVEKKPASAFMTQNHVPRCFIKVSLKSAVPDTWPFREQIGKDFEHQILCFVNIMQIAVDIESQRVTVFSYQCLKSCIIAI